MLVLVVWKMAPALTATFDKPVRLVLVGVGLWASMMIILPAQIHLTIATVAPWPCVVLGAAGLVASSALYLRLRRRLPEDPIEPPLGRPTPPDPPRVAAVHWLLPVLFPVGTLIVSVVIWLIP